MFLSPLKPKLCILIFFFKSEEEGATDKAADEPKRAREAEVLNMMITN